MKNQRCFDVAAAQAVQAAGGNRSQTTPTLNMSTTQIKAYCARSKEKVRAAWRTSVSLAENERHLRQTWLWRMQDIRARAPHTHHHRACFSVTADGTVCGKVELGVQSEGMSNVSKHWRHGL